MSGISVKKIRELESNVDKNVQNSNDIAQLLDILDESKYKSEIVIAAMQSLRRIFTKMISKNYLRPKYLNASTELNEAIEKYRLWLTDKYKTYLSKVVDLIASKDAVCQITALRIVLSFCQKGNYAEKETTPLFDLSLFKMIIAKLLLFPTLPEQIQICLKEEYFNYTDMKIYLYSACYDILRVLDKDTKESPTEDHFMIKQSLKAIALEDIITRILFLLTLMEKPIDETLTCLGILDKEQQSVQSQRFIFTRLIMMILKQSLNETLIQYILMKLHSDIMPYLTQPMFLADFLTDCYNYGGLIAVNALSGLFVLITEYDISYPDYYNKLYQLLTPQVFEMKYRQRFLILLVKSLRSSGISALTLAAFCKRLCRIAITSSPSTALFVIPLITELITYHSSLYAMIQVEDHEDIYDVVAVRKMLPGIEKDEIVTMKQKQSNDLIDEEDEEESDDENDENENNNEKEVTGEVDDNKPITVRSTTVLSSDILKKTLCRMQEKRERNEKTPELPAKQAKIEYHFDNLKEVIKNESAFDCFDNEAKTIEESKALDSYLWELYVLLNHYDPNVVEMMEKLKNKLLRTRQQFNSIVNCTYESEFNRLMKDQHQNYAFATKNVGYTGKECLMSKLFI